MQGQADAYRPEIDGLRALAVVAVVLFHGFPAALPGGFAGVDVFFVISGYLIGGIILSGLAAGSFSFIRFYQRRIRRLLPALALVLATTSLIAALLLPPSEFAAYTLTLRAAILSASNFVFAFRTGYFEPAAHQAPLLHTWSLSVEEQFYLAFPIAAWLVHRRWPRGLGALILGGAGLSFALAWWGSQAHPPLAFYLPHARFWELLAGVALWHFRPGERIDPAWREGAGWLGLALIAAAILLHEGRATPYPGPPALLPCLGTALVIEANRYGLAASGRLLAGRAAVGIGLISYPLYLWHWPLLVFARAFGPEGETIGATLAVIAASLLLSLLTYRFIERPLRFGGWLTPRRAFASLAAAALAFLGLSLGSEATRGLPQRFSPELRATFRAIDEWQGSARLACMTRPEAAPLAVPDGHPCRIGAPGEPDVIVWGDSHAASLQPALDQALKQAGRAGLVLSGGCRPIISLDGESACAAGSAARAGEIARHPARTIVIAQRWAALSDGVLPVERGYRPLPASERSARLTALERELRARIAPLVAAGKEVVLIGTVPEMPVHVPNAVGFRLNLGLVPPPGPSRATVDARQAGSRALLARLASEGLARHVEPTAAMCGETCPPLAGGRVLYFDNNHLTLAATPLLAPALAEALRR